MNKEDIKIYNEDCLKVMKEIADESIDLAVTDCPYRIISSGSGRKVKKGNEPSGIFGRSKEVMDGKMFEYNDIKFSEWLPDLYRIMKQKTHTYIMINARNLKELQEEAEKVGFEFQQLLVWAKNNCLMSNWYMNSYELILMLKKGEAKPINDCGSKNLIKIDNIIGEKIHPSQKPVELMEYLIKNSSNENEVVIDPFMGAGSTGLACKKLGRKFIGCEIDKKYYDMAEKKIFEGWNDSEIKTGHKEKTLLDFLDEVSNS